MSRYERFVRYFWSTLYGHPIGNAPYCADDGGGAKPPPSRGAHILQTTSQGAAR